MQVLKDGLKVEREGLTKFLLEMPPSGDKVFHETHDEYKINVKHDFRDSNFGLKTKYIPNIDIRKFDGKDLVTLLLHM